VIIAKVFIKKFFIRFKGNFKGYIYFFNVKGITKTTFPHLKRKQLELVNLDLI
jgi:hypothetical protein